MSSKTRILAFALAFAVMTGFAFSAQADVTGSFSTHIGVVPQTTATEVEALDFDIQNAINLTVVISGLSTTLHSHFGIAGVEDVQLTYAATLGALDINGQFVFGRFAASCLAVGPNCLRAFIFNNTVPQQSDMRFIKKRVKTSISLGGVSFENLAMFEDVTTNGPVVEDSVQPGVDTVFGGMPSAPTWGQTPVYGFGDVITLAGQTPSGVSIEASTGICAELHPNVIKKHSWPYRVNPHCAGVEFENTGTAEDPSWTINNSNFLKPDLMFDFETLNITGVPIASGVTSNAFVNCVRTTQCSLTNTFNFSGTGPIPFSVSFFFQDLFTFAFNGAELTFSTGAGELIVEVLADGTIGAVEVDLSTTLNPDTNPATLNVNANMTPGVGLTDADISLAITRSNVDFSIAADFSASDNPAINAADFEDVTFSVGTTMGAVDVSTSATFGAFGFISSDTTFTLSF